MDRVQADRLEAFLRRAPKAELHLHLEGAVPWELVRAWSPEPLPAQPSWWARDHRFDSFADFLRAMRPCWRPVLNSLERIAGASRGLFASLRAQNVRYVEVSFGLGAYEFSTAEVVDAIKGAAPEGLTVQVFAGISRDRMPDTMPARALEAVRSGALDGIDLHGDEAAGRLQAFAAVYKEAQAQGLMAKAHSGEFGSAESVRETVEALGVRRIEHGIAAVQDADVVRFLVDRGVTLDVCPWSNVKLRAAPSLRSHPLKALYEAGVRVTVNTDDPTVFGQTLTDELRWLATEMGLGVGEVAEVAGNGFRVARMDGGEREGYLKEIAAAAEQLRG